MRRKIILICLSILFSYSLVFCEEEYRKVCFNNTCINVEVVSSEPFRQQGLMFRTSLEDDSGMLFVYEYENIYSFWMKNMFIPLDIIWIGKDKKIVYISRNASPCEESCEGIVPDKLAKYVLEVNAGFVDKYSIKLGEEVVF